ncbi:MAG: GNAT family N-acetyltransferase [Mesorhizobium sp.]|uniref:GNAT family N-acetyltransferase n=1 Tax=Mesorhizobium sp. TaxID=1871066 RepID=UPI00120C76AC|nr:GNAT family N-acetyltransferase [Mesorhizobium sp.]TIN32326.1 MAG: GNAT family N-acetyltransferase [Mesorhizobium sp.]TJU83533.1 MAG: GNAT family N-acetyltransferase [Mesorhizobium sp.]
MPVILKTARLRLRPLAAWDLVRLHALHNDPLVVDALYEGKPPSWADTYARLNQFLTDWKRYGFGFFAVFEHHGNSREDSFLGRRGLRLLPNSDDLELGACFHQAASGKGFGPEAGCAVLDFAFTALGAPRVLCVVRPENQRSLRAVGKMGFRQIDDRWCRGRLMRCFEVIQQDFHGAVAANPMFARIHTLPQEIDDEWHSR